MTDTAAEFPHFKRKLALLSCTWALVTTSMMLVVSVTALVGNMLAEDKSLAAIVQATSAGMEGADPGEAVAGAVSWTTVPPSAVALDVVYAPTDTPFLRACAARGLRAEHGLGMLARQGALAFELWTGLEAPFERMLEAARTGRV